MITRTFFFVTVSLATFLTTVRGVPSNPLPLFVPPKDLLDDTSSNYLAEAYFIQEFDDTTTWSLSHDYFKRTVCYWDEPTVLPLHTSEFA